MHLSKKSRVSGVVAAACVLALGGFALTGCDSGSGSGSTDALGTTVVSEDELDDVVGSYTYNGTTTEVTAREVIEDSTSLDSAVNDDGTYNLPTADDIVSYVRNAVVLADADERGITVSDDEVAEYAESALGTSDYATIASNYGLDEDTVEQMLKDSAVMSKLRDEVTDTVLPDYPDAPTYPEDENEDTASAEYAEYIIALAGDEWDSDAGTWASTDGDYYAALSAYEITNDSATYAAAEAAYEVAYTAYSTASTELSSEWTAYVNSIFCNVTISLGTAAA